MVNAIPDPCTYADCIAEAAAPYAQCLGHLPAGDRSAFLAQFKPGDDFAARGVAFGYSLLKEVESAFRAPGGRAPRFGRADFTGAVFRCPISWMGAVFDGPASFAEARFENEIGFWDAEFSGDAEFQKSEFVGAAGFSGVKVARQLRLDRIRARGPVQLNGIACQRLDLGAAHFEQAADLEEASVADALVLDGTWFHGQSSFNRIRLDGYLAARQAHFEGTTTWFAAAFGAQADFTSCVFVGEVWFDDSKFAGQASLKSARFHEHAHFAGVEFASTFDLVFARFDDALRIEKAVFRAEVHGPLRAEAIVATGARFDAAVRLEVLASVLRLDEARFASATVISVRYARIELTYAVLDAPLTLLSQPSEFLGHREAEGALPEDPRGSLASITGCDSANLILHDIDLSRCAFTGAYHLDQLRLEGRCSFAGTPRGWRFARSLPPAVRWTARKALAEEHVWRAREIPGRRQIERGGWNSGPLHTPAPEPTPASLAALYRQLRKCFEDNGDAPGADDFYYGEMEARRHDRETPWGERVLLHAYWLVSGYALRATRALGFLLLAMTATLLALMLFGLPDTSTAQQITGTAPASGHQVALTLAAPDAELSVPVADRFSTARAEQAALIVVNSVVFRSPDEALTTPGTWIEMTSRLCEPVLLGFAAFAARGRVKR